MEHVSKYSDVFLATFVVLVVGMMIIPLPTALLDILLTLNIAMAMTILIVVLYISTAIRLASFPSILLIATLFRLALNVSTTRLILLHADAGHVIRAFGEFVVQGNMIVGAIVFLILTLVNFVVVSKGSERVAEVAARFTLDAMPGKQMAIDADLRAGLLDMSEARERRRELSRESQLFGAMDGAMKFVKGDAIAGILITVVNIAGGVAIGVTTGNLDAGAAVKTYGLLTIGDGLLSQIPALILSVAAGLMVTRVEPESSGDHLGKDISVQILSYPKAFAIVSVLLFSLGLVPGLPLFPFWLLGFLVSIITAYLKKKHCGYESNSANMRNSSAESSTSTRETDISLPSPISVYLGDAVTRFLSAESPDSAFFTKTLSSFRKNIYRDTGVHLPAIRILGFQTALPENGFEIHVLDTPVYRGCLHPDKAFLEGADDGISLLNAEIRSEEIPDAEINGALVPIERQECLEKAGYTVHSGDSFFILQLRIVLLRYLNEFIGLQEVKWLCDELEQVYPDTVRECVPRLISYQRLGDILRRLVQEQVCIRDLKRILETVSEYAEIEPDNVALTERVRVKLSRQIHHQFSEKGQLDVFLLDPSLEAIFRSSIHVSGQERFLAMTPDVMEKVILSFQRHLGDGLSNKTPVILTVEQSIRYVLWRFLTQQIQEIRVLAAQEIPPGAQFAAIGCISLE